ncbi:UNVERIFIED_CONTAM: Non-canonical poly(A) RNA polymerase PAPD5 [Trichonephila clavipes]
MTICYAFKNVRAMPRVEIFGSFRTGLFLPSSDIDMVIFGEWKNIPLNTLSQALQNNGILKSDIEIIASAKVPIVRVLHSPSGIKVDISFNMNNGVKSARLIKKLMKEHPSLPKLVLVLKQFLLHRNLNEVYNGGMSSYCLTLLIVSFLKGHHKPKCDPSVNLGTVLLEFFEHYGINFNYQKVSIHFQEDALYRPKLKPGNFLSVEDPMEKGNDVAKGTFLMHQLRLSFQNAFYLLCKVINESSTAETNVGSFLYLIFQVDSNVMAQRDRLLRNHSKIMQTLSHLIEQPNQSQSEEFGFNSKPKLGHGNFSKRKKFR